MRLLLDTHVAVWSITERARLGKSGLALIQNAEDILVSAVSIWEIAIKQSLGRQRDGFPFSAREASVIFDDAGFLLLDIAVEHTIAVEALPLLHRDPFDRLLIAQAQCENVFLISADSRLQSYGDPVLAL